MGSFHSTPPYRNIYRVKDKALLNAADNLNMTAYLAPIHKSEVMVGQPLPWPLYDRSRKLLLQQGFVLESMSQIEQLIEIGLFRPAEGSMTGVHGAISASRGDETLSHPATPKPTDSGTPGVTIANANLEIGMAVQLTADGFPDDRNMVKLIGFLDKQSIIVTHPLKDGAVAFIKEGKGFHCRAFQKRNAYSFSTSVLKSQLIPFPYLHLTYPANVSAVAVRKSSRIPVEIIASVGLKSGSARVPCLIRDLSISGMLIQSREKLGENQAVLSIAFRLSIDKAPTLFELDLVVCNNTTGDNDKNKGIYRAGCQFEEVNPDLHRMLELYIYRKLAQEAE
jgi:c-di-GMP-binding flagellar brake protein YcgR